MTVSRFNCPPQWKLLHLIKLHFDTVNYSQYIAVAGIKSDFTDSK
jgi:hypothetical protein